MSAIVIKKTLDSSIIDLGKRVNAFVGKRVEIVIREIPFGKPAGKVWRHLGAINLKGKTDKINIREFAHDD